MKPKTLLKFVLEQSNIGMEVQSIRHQTTDRANRFYKIQKYAKFLSQRPQKWMFVPTDDNGNVLEKPKSFYLKGLSNEEVTYLKELESQYQKALDRVIFEGFELFGNTLYIPNLISIKINKKGETEDFENLDELISEFPEYLKLIKPIV